LVRRTTAAAILRLLLLAACVVVTAPAALTVVSGAAHAQEERTHRVGLFEFLFGRRDRSEPEASKQQRPVRRAPAAARQSEPQAPPQPETVEKLENARTVLVVGDFMAGGLAEGLEDAFAQSPGVRVESRANGSSGFVRDDYYDWPGSIGAILEEVKPAAVVVMIGANDRQQMTVGENRERVRSEAWTQEYTARARKLAAAIRQARVPLFWVGMPSFKVSSMSADMLAFNDIYRSAAEEVGGEFIDIWDGFIDENGAFAAVGPDMNGQRVRLRGSDGINLTSAGKRKVAFYVERPLNKLLGNAAAPGLASLGPQTGPGIGLGLQDPAEIDRTPPISLNDPALDGSGALFGGQQAGSAEDKKLGIPVEKLVHDGIAAPGRPGRADNFSTLPAETAQETQPAAQAASTTETTSIVPTE
jgi:hypothetical protein